MIISWILLVVYVPTIWAMDSAGLQRLVLHVPVNLGLDKKCVKNAMNTGVDLHLISTVSTKLPKIAIQLVREILEGKRRGNSNWIIRLQQYTLEYNNLSEPIHFSLNRHDRHLNLQSGMSVYPIITEYPMDLLGSPFIFLYEQLLRHNTGGATIPRNFAPLIVDLEWQPDNSMVCSLPDEVLMGIAVYLTADSREFRNFRSVCKRFLALPLGGVMSAESVVRHWQWWFGGVRGDRDAFAWACSQGTIAKRNRMLYDEAIYLMFTRESE